jgi:dsRNA-specific ribonuclease
MAHIDQTKWLQELQSFLNNLLAPIIKDQVNRNRYLDGNAMRVWARAFTHETTSPSDNYEDLEFLGDAILKAVFPKYLMQRLPYLHKGEYTELNIAYMSKITQAELARKMGLEKHIRVTGIDRVILNLETDVFESFFGALDTISDMVFSGLGFINCYNMIIHIFSSVDIDETKARGSSKTQVIQMFVRFDLPKPDVVVDNSDKFNIKFSVVLTNEHISFLRNHGVNITSPVIGLSIASTKKDAEYEAYEKAFKTLQNLGITTEWAEKTKQLRDFSDSEVTPFVPRATERLKNEGFVSMHFFVPRKTVTQKGAIVQLLGQRPNGIREVLEYTYTSERENSYRTAKSEIVRKYAAGFRK